MIELLLVTLLALALMDGNNGADLLWFVCTFCSFGWINSIDAIDTTSSPHRWLWAYIWFRQRRVSHHYIHMKWLFHLHNNDDDVREISFMASFQLQPHFRHILQRLLNSFHPSSLIAFFHLDRSWHGFSTDEQTFCVRRLEEFCSADFSGSIDSGHI